MYKSATKNSRMRLLIVASLIAYNNAALPNIEVKSSMYSVNKIYLH